MKGNKETASGRKGDEAGISVSADWLGLQESLLRRFGSVHSSTMI
jgi:hypothetical protein